jgi:hypothetical protein
VWPAALVRGDVLAYGDQEGSFGVHDLLAQVVPGLDERIDKRLTWWRSACHRVANISGERLQVAQGVEDSTDAEQMQSTPAPPKALVSIDYTSVAAPAGTGTGAFAPGLGT